MCRLPWAGGTITRDTAGFGGKGEPYWLLASSSLLVANVAIILV